MSYSLLAAGSNSGGQLGFGNLEDSHQLKACLTSNGSTFPPSSSKILQLSSGANHTIALLEVGSSDNTESRKEIWVTGSGSQGQIGMSNVGGEDEESFVTSFKKLDFEKDLGLKALVQNSLNSRYKSADLKVEPLHVACGWNTSYIAFRVKQSDEGGKKNRDEAVKDPEAQSSNVSRSDPCTEKEEDILISLGMTNDFGELGIGQPTVSSSTTSASTTVNFVPLPQVFETPASSTKDLSSASDRSQRRQRIECLQAGPRHVLCLLSSDLPDSESDQTRRSSGGNKDCRATSFSERILIGWGAARHGQVGTPPSPAAIPELPKSSAPGSRARPGRSSPSAVAWKPQVISKWKGSSSQEEHRSSIAAGRDHSAFLFNSQEPSTSPPSLRLQSIGSNRLGQCSQLGFKAPQIQDIASHAEEWIPTQVSSCWNTTSVLCQRSRPSSTASTSAGTQEPARAIEQAIWSCGANGKGQWGSGESKGSESDSHFTDLSSILTADGSKRIVALISGSEHSLVLVKDVKKEASEVWGWGWSEHGNLAQGDETDRITPVLIWSSSHEDNLFRSAEDIWAGCGTTFIQLRSVNSERSRLPSPSKKQSEFCKSLPKIELPSPSKKQLEFCKSLPKIELHAHLNGSIRRSTLSELANKKGIDPQQSQIVKGDARSLSEMFTVFDVIHRCVRGASVIRRISREMLEDLESDGVVYVEVRTTPRAHEEEGMAVEDYIEAVLKGFKEYEEESRDRRTSVISRLILSIDRRDKPEVSLKTVDLAIKFKNQGGVGIDLSGDPTKGEWKDWEPSLRKARENGLKITLHAGEVPEKEEEMSEMLKFKPDRFGHVCFISDESLSLLGKMRTPLELCLTSNVLSNSVPSYEEHHFLRHHPSSSLDRPLKDNVVCLSTDDSAVFGSPLSREYALAMAAFGLGESQIENISRTTLEAVFIDGEVKERVKKRLFQEE